MIGLTATASTPGLDGLAANLQGRLQLACTEAARAIQQAYENEAPRDTGSMALSVSVQTADGQSDFGPRTAMADAVNPKVRVMDLLPSPPFPGAIVQVPVEHGYWVEHGTTRMPPRPTFTRIVEDTRAPFKAAVAKALES